MAIVRDFTALLSGSAIHDTAGRAAFYSFSFPTLVPAHHKSSLSADAVKTFRPFTEAEKAAARAAIDTYAAASGLKFFEVAAGQGDILFAAYNLALITGPGTAGFAYFPAGEFDGAINSDIFMDSAFAGDRHTLLHEIGHAIGLKHPFEGSTTLAGDLDNFGKTVMSYTPGSFAGDVLGTLDKQAIAHLYGAATADGTQVASWSWNAATRTLSQNGFSGNDKIYGIGSADIIKALAGNDFIQGRGGNDQLDGGAGDDIIDAGAGNDTALGGLGRDIFYGDDGDDTLSGDDGEDSVSGEGGNDVLSGGLGRDALDGGEGADRLSGGADGDSLYGGNGDDVLDGGAGVDSLQGDAGNDIYVIDSLSDSISEVFFNAGGRDTVRSSISYSISGYIEDLVLTGTSALDGTGNGAANTITGNSAINVLRGAGGTDVLKAGAAADSLFGGTGADSLYGGTGNDRLRGDDAPTDRGRDRFYFDTTPNASSNRDTIVDFNPADDSIYLKKSGIFAGIASLGTLGPAAFARIDNYNPSSPGTRDTTTDDYRIIYDKVSGKLYYDADGHGGSATALWFATVNNGSTHPTLTNADFIVF